MNNLSKRVFLGIGLLTFGIGPSVSAAKWSNMVKQDAQGAAAVEEIKPAQASDQKGMPSYLPSYVKQNLITPGVFETEGYVTFVYNPYDGTMHQRLIIVGDQKAAPENKAVRIKIKDAQGLQKGGHYRFTVKAEPANKPQQPLELVTFTPIK